MRGHAPPFFEGNPSDFIDLRFNLEDFLAKWRDAGYEVLDLTWLDSLLRDGAANSEWTAVPADRT